LNGINYDLGLILHFYVWIWEYLYRKSLAVRLDSFVNLLIPINTEAVPRERQIREKNLQTKDSDTEPIALANTMMLGGLPGSAQIGKREGEVPA
jgi:hypothetical protein